jgi:DNA gyrase subunit B
MTRDFGAEIDAIKEELREMRKLMLTNWDKEPIRVEPGGEEKRVLPPEGYEQLRTLRQQIVASTAANDSRGAVAYTGTFCSGNADETRQSIWASAVHAEDLLALNDNRMVEKVLASVGNNQRLTILLALLEQPLTVNQLVEKTGANSTGQVYHHLKPLAAADIINEEKGVYSVIPYRMQGIILLLAGVNDLIDARYTHGDWKESA